MSTNAATPTKTTQPVAPTTIPVASREHERVAAAQRRAAFPYHFPRDQRRLGGAFTVDENARRLQRFFYLERRLSHALGSWTLAIGEFEVKVETGRHIFWHMDAARILRARLNEQERRLVQIDDFRDPQIDAFINEMLSAANVAELLVGVHQVVGRALQRAYRHHIDMTCPVADAPTIRALKQILLDTDDMLTWADAAVAAFIQGGVAESSLESWRWHLGQLLASIGGVTGAEPLGERPRSLRTDTKPYVRNTVPMRDSRFVTFQHVGDHNVFDGTPRYPHGSYELERLTFIRAQRDEVDAIEAFGTFLWDIANKGFDAEHALARITWDESRHTEMGHRSMLASGFDPFELPNRLTSSVCRGPMAAEFGMAEINLFGEVGVMKNIGGIIDRAKEHGDTVLGHVADYIRSDERTHVRNGQKILKTMTTLDNPTLELRTREVFTECLVGLGVIKAGEPGFVISREDVERFIGE
jgi:hypothetical protein